MMSEIPEMLPVEQFIIIDNDDSTLFLCRVIVQRTFKNISVTTYNKPRKAIDYLTIELKANPVAVVVLLDINMPEMSGWEVLDSISMLDAETKDKLTIIILSSSINPGDKLKAVNHPLVLGYLEKPLTSARLEEIMTKMKSAMV